MDDHLKTGARAKTKWAKPWCSINGRFPRGFNVNVWRGQNIIRGKGATRFIPFFPRKNCPERFPGMSRPARGGFGGSSFAGWNGVGGRNVIFHTRWQGLGRFERRKTGRSRGFCASKMCPPRRWCSADHGEKPMWGTCGDRGSWWVTARFFWGELDQGEAALWGAGFLRVRGALRGREGERGLGCLDAEWLE